MSDYFRSSANKEAGQEASRLITQKIHSKSSNIHIGIGFFEGTFKLQVKDSSCLYQDPPRKQHMHSKNHSRRTEMVTETTDNSTM